MINSVVGRRLPFLLACLALAACAPAAPNPALVATSPGVKRLSAADTDFGFRLLHQLTANPSESNVFFSPFSISQALLLTMNGAGGQTRQDMARTLGLETMPQDQINAANALLLPSLTNPDPKVQVSVANALWANRGVTLNPVFQERSRRFYQAQATTLNLSSPAAVQTINGWVSRNTQGKITQLVTHPEIFSAEVVLTNAVYFHGKWQSPFDKARTDNQPFFLAGGRTKSVPLMSQEGRFAYLETPQFQMVSLPYGTGRMSLYVLLPKAGTRLSTLVEGMNSRSAGQWIGTTKTTRIMIRLPRFHADYAVTLNAPLAALGMESAFGAGADFRPMGLKGACISAVIHKAVLDVDEEGTVAAAATAVVIGRAVMRPAPLPVMRVDHPFFCAIHDNVTGAVLFEGVIQDPQQKSHGVEAIQK